MNIEYELVRFFEGLEAWHWGIFAMVLLAAEMFISGFVLLWFGASAILVAGLLLAAPHLSWEAQLTIWGATSVVTATAWYVYRRFFPVGFAPGAQTLNRRGEAYVGRSFVLEDPVISHRGALKVSDTVWRIEAEVESLPAGTRVEVTDVVGTLLRVKAHS